MKDLGEADVILGVKIRKIKTGLSFCQSHYVEKILKEFDSFDVSPIRIPYDASKHLKKNKGDNVSEPEYAKIIGSVMYLMNYTRPDIAYAVSRLSRYTHNPDRYHWDALRHLLRHLKRTLNHCLHFNKFPVVLEGYCDANGSQTMMRLTLLVSMYFCSGVEQYLGSLLNKHVSLNKHGIRAYSIRVGRTGV
ncbi:ty1-copia retrotransposon protein [Cucumis melo var. makuwa]|uniref:Ty1-copia retrotransposon protein n=1 Tax=Cucumis melo var. makuwa TaxID=1194695 RepID=A0A5D3BI80_CUCMM|nr:ty1-copia retrotransposon protein [Cucumis melo var. makuwa]